MHGPIEKKQLFRQEALSAQSRRLHGNVSITTPMSWQVIGWLLLALLVAAIGFLTFASYARVETVAGEVTLDRGIATIMPSRPGIVSEISVKEGQSVRKGDRIAVIRAEEDLVQGPTAPERMKKALEQQDESLAAQIDLLRKASVAEQDRLNEQIRGFESDIASLDQRIGHQKALVTTSEEETESIRKIASNGIVTQRDFAAREAVLLQRRQQLLQLEQDRTARRGSIAEARRSIAQAGAQTQAEIASISSSRAELDQRLAEIELARGYAVTAPMDGVVTALTARVGQRVADTGVLMLVVPSDAVPRVELHVPSAAAGFLETGQDVRLAIDAFPYQRFGTIAARVTEISSAAVVRETAEGRTPVYLVTAALDRPSVQAFGREQNLLPGMTLSARIVTEERSLLEWLFEPIYAVRNR